MHHINDDPRCVKSAQLIEKALFDALAENGNNLEAISVSQIAERAGISRATFYRHFDAPVDVLIWVSNREVKASADCIPLFSNNYSLFCRNFFEYWYHNSELLDILVAVGKPSIFLISLEKFLRGVSDRVFLSSKLPENEREYLIEIWSAIVWSILKCWVLRDKAESASELSRIAIHSLPKPA